METTKLFFKPTPPSPIAFQPTQRWVKDLPKQFAAEWMDFENTAEEPKQTQFQLSPIGIQKPTTSSITYELNRKFSEKPTLDNLRMSLEDLRGHVLLKNVTKVSIPKIGCGLDKLQWTDVFKLIQETFTYYGFQIQIITKRETDFITGNPHPTTITMYKMK